MKTFLLCLFVGLSLAQADVKATHGMLVVGGEDVYFSHLPMFMKPHDYQAIFKVAIPEGVKTKFAAYRKAHPSETVFTVAPSRFDLPAMAKSPEPFTATLFSGIFDRGGKAISEVFDVKITQVVYFNKLDPQSKGLDHPQYIVFGSNGLMGFMADYDQVLSVEIKNLATQEALKKSPFAIVEIPAADNRDPLAAPSIVAARLLSEATTDELVVLKQVHLEKDDLKEWAK
jgi:hypothetical protein